MDILILRNEPKVGDVDVRGHVMSKECWAIAGASSAPCL